MAERAEGRRLTRRQLLVRGSLLAVGGTAAYTFLLEPEWLELRRVTVPVPELPTAFEGYRIAVIADVHYPRRIDPAFIARSADLAASFRPDLILMPGDFVDGHDKVSPLPDLRGLFDGLKAPDGVFGCMGNHDVARERQGVRRALERQTPVQMLDNTHTVLRRRGERLVVAGIDDVWYGKPDFPGSLRGAAAGPRILLCHNPDFAEDDDSGLRTDLVLSGHTHGGEARLPIIGDARLPSKYGSKFRHGLVQGRAHRVYVTRGIGSPRGFRFRARPEVTALTLVRG